MKIRCLPLLPLFVLFVFSCLAIFKADARQVTCPNCGGNGMTKRPVLNGIQSYYGCTRCGGSGGGGSPGVPGNGVIEVADDPPPDTPNTQPKNNAQPPQDDQAAAAAAEAARQATEAERQRAVAEAKKKEQEEAARKQAEFENAKCDALNDLKGFTKDDYGLKGLGTGGDSASKDWATRAAPASA